MITSACGPAAMASATSLGDVAADGHHAPEGALHVALERPLVGGDEVVGHGGAARVGVLDDGDGRLPGAGVRRQLVHQAPGGVTVEEVEVRQRVPAVLLPWRPTSSAVPAMR